MDGFLSYEKTGKITKEFMDDFENLTTKLWRQSKLLTSLEDFQGYCTEKLVIRIGAFDSTRSNIGNYVYNLILNEARRIRSKERHESTVEFENVLLYQEAPEHETQGLLHSLFFFARRAYELGIYIDQEQILAHYQANMLTPAVKAFAWLRDKGKL